MNDWDHDERLIINSSVPLKVWTIADEEENMLLRQKSEDLSEKELKSDLFTILCDKMVATVTDPSQDGVGIAGPQVGLLKRIVAVQRFDKEGEPFEVYPNIRIVGFNGEKTEGPEGCLSVPDRRGVVARYRDIDIRYETVVDGKIKEVTENVQGFTAVIFQHECDHLDGVLYIDYE